MRTGTKSQTGIQTDLDILFIKGNFHPAGDNPQVVTKLHGRKAFHPNPLPNPITKLLPPDLIRTADARYDLQSPGDAIPCRVRLEQTPQVNRRPQWRFSRAGLQHRVIPIIFVGIFKGNGQRALLLHYKLHLWSLFSHDTDADFRPGHGALPS